MANHNVKKILIVGAGSYVGENVRDCLKSFADDYSIDSFDVERAEVTDDTFCGYDVVYHVAGIAHSDNGKVSKERQELYKRINTDLVLACAAKAKCCGVRQYIFMSSAIVYGSPGPIGKRKVVNESTPPHPANYYGASKLNAERGLLALAGDGFRVCIVRSPLVYGKDCRGNFPLLEKIATRFSFFPKVSNARSVIYIKNLAEFIKCACDNDLSGVFLPQNQEPICTSDLVRRIAAAKGRTIRLIPGFEWLIRLLAHFSPRLGKAFGNMQYDPSCSHFELAYNRFSLEESLADIYR